MTSFKLISKVLCCFAVCLILVSNVFHKGCFRYSYKWMTDLIFFFFFTNVCGSKSFWCCQRCIKNTQKCYIIHHRGPFYHLWCSSDSPNGPLICTCIAKYALKTTMREQAKLSAEQEWPPKEQQNNVMNIKWILVVSNLTHILLTLLIYLFASFAKSIDLWWIVPLWCELLCRPLIFQFTAWRVING